MKMEIKRWVEFGPGPGLSLPLDDDEVRGDQQTLELIHGMPRAPRPDPPPGEVYEVFHSAFPKRVEVIEFLKSQGYTVE